MGVVLSDIADWWTELWKGVGDWFMATGEEGGITNLDRILFAIVTVVVGHFLIKLIIWLIKKAFHIPKKLNLDVSVKTFSISVVNVILNILLAVFVLWILNVNMISIAGVLSAVTVAIGLALQDMISSFASGVVLLNSKHFVTGDYIGIDHDSGHAEGTVVRVQILATSLLTPQGQTIIIPNGKVNSGVITNYTKNAKRRLDLIIAVDYSTDLELVRKVAKDLFKADDRILQDPAPFIFVEELGEYAVMVHFRCWTKHQNYWDIRNGINEKILLAFRKNGIKIPFRRIVVEEKARTLTETEAGKDAE